MASPEYGPDQPLTPAGRLFVQPKMNQVIHCILGFKNPISVDSFKSTVLTLMLKHPRFSSLLVVDSHGLEHWRPTIINPDKHILIINQPIVHDDHQRAVNEYLADLTVSTPLSTEKPLWEIHLLMAHDCAVFRLHHALGDGISLMSMLLASCRKVDDPDALPTLASAKGSKSRREKGWIDMLWECLRMVWFTLIYVVGFCLRVAWVRDKKTSISGGDGLELWPRKSAVARFLLDDMKVVKGAIPSTTINDVLFGVISAGLSQYLDHRSPKSLPEGLQLTGLAMVNLRQQPGLHDLSDLMKSNPKSGWGNKFGMLILPVYYYKSCTTPLLYLERAKAVIDRKKLSLEAYFSYRIGDFVMKYLGAKIASLLNYRILCNTTFTVSNVAGPLEDIAVDGNPISYIRATSCALPHALTMHMVSYAGRADMQILVAKDIIPDPDFLAKCFEGALLEMKEAALTKA